MILNLILAACIAFFAYLLKQSNKENKKLVSEHESYTNRIQRLIVDLDNSKRELDRLLDRNSYLESKLVTFSKENDMLGKKNDELTKLHSLAKDSANNLKFKLIELEERMHCKKMKDDEKKEKAVKKGAIKHLKHDMKEAKKGIKDDKKLTSKLKK